MKIAIERELQIKINHKKVLRLMNKYNLLSLIRRKYIYKGSYKLNKYENLFNRDFVAESINQKWTTDISYITTPEGRLYLSVIKDCFDGSIVAYRYSSNMSMGLVTSTIKVAIQKEKVVGTRLHSDQGFQYTSNEYKSLTKEYGIIPSMSRAGTPIDNAPIESFFSILKSECIYLQKIKTMREAKYLIDEFIDYYNNDRIQLKSKLAPLEVRKNYLLQASL
jgi:transposase InsO family protein